MYLCFKTILSAKPFLWKLVLHAIAFSYKSKHFHKNGFALRHALKQMHNGTRKWPIINYFANITISLTNIILNFIIQEFLLWNEVNTKEFYIGSHPWKASMAWTGTGARRKSCRIHSTLMYGGYKGRCQCLDWILYHEKVLRNYKEGLLQKLSLLFADLYFLLLLSKEPS